ncbi:MAG: PHP domain-containing protein, partial [Syntrophomonadaceae bacterium]|nr:PHP domain-containing protein [Syntrophomonadaceae bacterium]
MRELVGNIHIHTRYSDGSGDIPTIARAAEKAGLDFIIITDHHHLKGKVEEGYYGQVMVLVGSEINEEFNHYLALDIEEPVPGDDHEPQNVIDVVNNQGGFGFIAHGIEKGSPVYKKGKTFPWNDWQVTGFTGIDIWSYLSQWRDEITGIPKGLYLYCNPHYAFRKGPMRPLLRKWDELLQERMVVGIGCSDAHAIKLKWGPWRPTLSDYYLCFRCINTHLIIEKSLSGDFVKDKALIYECLKSGRCFVGYDYFKKTTGFSFVARNQGQMAFMGEKAR